MAPFVNCQLLGSLWLSILLTPSTTSISPEMYALARLAKNTAGPIKSSGTPQRPPGMPLRRFDTNAGS